MRTSLVIACTVGALGCASVAQPDTPAVIVDATSESRSELLRTVTTALKRNDVVLADDALTRDSLLVIERKVARDPTGQRLSGRDFEKPDQFQLVVNGSRCALVYVQSGQRYELERTHCAAK